MIRIRMKFLWLPTRVVDSHRVYVWFRWVYEVSGGGFETVYFLDHRNALQCEGGRIALRKVKHGSE